jgi:polyhydroxybutyrate depolymerase
LAVVAGTVGGREPDQNTMEVVPPAKQSLPVLMMHGTEDTHVPYEGGAQEAKAGKREFASVQRSALFWVEADHCKGRPAEQKLKGEHILIQEWTNCSRGSEVQVYTLRGWGHFWPCRKLIQQYGQSDNLSGFDAAEVIWSFLQNKRNPK